MNADEFYKRLCDEHNKSKVLSDMFIAFIGRPEKSNIYQIIGKLTKIYGEKRVFFAILDCADMDNINIDNVYPLLTYFVKKRLESDMTVKSSVDLSDFAAKINSIKVAKVKNG